MGVHELMKTEGELVELASLLQKEVRNPNLNVVSRFIQLTNDAASFTNGKKETSIGYNCNINKEIMPLSKGQGGLFTNTVIPFLEPYSFVEASIQRDIAMESKFILSPKGTELPTDELFHFEPVPYEINIYDEELKAFTEEHKSTQLTRQLLIDQRIIVNSKGGMAVQSTPYFSIGYNHGFLPSLTSRELRVVCNTNDDLKKMTKLIKYIADPTIDRRIKNSKDFSQAFHELHEVSRLKQGSFNEAGVPLSTLYDVVVPTGVPVHEIFGHHFEELVNPISFGSSGTFKYGQVVDNDKIILKDNPKQEIEGFRVSGFTIFDSYARLRPERVHIKNGEVMEFLGSEYVDDEKLKNFLGIEKSPFVGNASTYIEGSFPQARMSCTVLDGQTESIDLEGKIIAVAHSGSTDPNTKTYEIMAYEAYVIKDDEPVRVLPIKVSGGINQALENIHLIDDTNYQTGFCSKSNPINRNQPARVPVSQLAKSQLWKSQQVYTAPISDEHLKALTKIS